MGILLGLLFLVAILVVGLGFPSWLAARRDARLAAALPGALRSIGRLAGAGRATGAALAAAATELGGPLGRELQQVTDEQRAGRPLVESLEAMAARAPRCVELRILVTAITLAEESSSDLAALLSRIEANLSDRIARNADARARTTQARIQAFILAGMLPIAALGIWLVQPDYLLEAWSDPLGRMVFQVAALWAALGLLVIFVLVRSRP